MPYFQRQLLANGTTAPSPYLSGNPQLSRIAQISGTESNGNQAYNALQTTLRKRFSAGLEFQAAYTYSKGMSDAIGYYGEGGQAASQSAYWQYLYDRRAEWGPTYFDVTHSFSLSHFYALPFGKGKAYGDNMPTILEYIVGNWQVGGILTLHTGFPLTIRGPDNSGTNSRGARADRIGAGGTLGNVGPGAKWFDTSAYAITRAGTLGSAGNGTERGPGLNQYDFSLQKQFPITERFRLEFRAEFLNLTNTPQFNAPSSTVNSATFGEVRGSQNERQAQLAMKLYF
jgi:hypothetical protein